MADTAAHFAEKSLFCEFDCSQAYHCVQLADPLLVQLLAFNSASRTMVCQGLARGLNRAKTRFSLFVRNYLEPCLSANICIQFMDNLVCGIDSSEHIHPNFRKIFQCLQRSGLKMSPKKFVSGFQHGRFLDKTITEEALKPEKEKIEKFL